MRAANPRWALFSVGYRNRWDFPDPAVVARYRRAGARVRTTAAAGALRIDLTPELGVSGYRKRADRYWNAGAPPPPMGALESGGLL